jgi:catechol 2,3-dioxygenase-like lactoylglutathione lyase family enzyme
MILMPIVYVQEMEPSVEFYERLGFAAKSRSEMWSELAAGDGALLALHKAPPDQVGRVELALVAEEPLERVAALVTPYRGIADEAFGRSLVVQDPSGMKIQVNEHDPTFAA